MEFLASGNAWGQDEANTKTVNTVEIILTELSARAYTKNKDACCKHGRSVRLSAAMMSMVKGTA